MLDLSYKQLYVEDFSLLTFSEEFAKMDISIFLTEIRYEKNNSASFDYDDPCFFDCL